MTPAGFAAIRIPVASLIAFAEYYNVCMDYISGVSGRKTEFPKA